MTQNESSLGYQIKMIQHAIRLSMDRLLREINLTTPQYAALSALDGNPGISGAALARKCFVTPQTMNEIINNLLESGYIERKQHPEHGRIIQTYLTPLGKDILAQANLRISTIDQQLSASLTLTEQQRIITWLKECYTTLTSA